MPVLGLHLKSYRHVGRQADTQADRRTIGPTDIQTDRRPDRETDKWTDRQAYRGVVCKSAKCRSLPAASDASAGAP